MHMYVCVCCLLRNVKVKDLVNVINEVVWG